MFGELIGRHDPALDLLRVYMDDTGALGWAVDMGVYTRNRNFRLYHSSKVGQWRPLVPVLPQPRFPMLAATTDPVVADERVFLDSLICNVSAATAVPRLLFCTTEPRLAEVRSGNDSDGLGPAKRLLGAPATVGNTKSSPFPAVDACVLSFVSLEGAKPAHIRRWAYFAESKTLTIDVAGSRFCHNVGRQHKSNG
jgi:hypothetical protein